jgi:aminomethyltransferase
MNKSFIGKEALLKIKEEGLPQRLIGIEVVDPGIVREGAVVYSEAGERVGWVTSGTKPPTVNKSVALAFVAPSSAAIGTPLKVDVRGKILRTVVIKKPFYKRQDEAKSASAK